MGNVAKSSILSVLSLTNIPMKKDMHFHTNLSDGRIGNKEALEKVKLNGLDFAICTDHDIINLDFPSLAHSQGIQSCEGVEIS